MALASTAAMTFPGLAGGTHVRNGLGSPNRFNSLLKNSRHGESVVI